MNFNFVPSHAKPHFCMYELNIISKKLKYKNNNNNKHKQN